MTQARWQQLERIFREAIALDGGERDHFLTMACKGDSDLYEEARRLLAAHDCSGDFLSDPACSLWSSRQTRPSFETGQVVAGRFRIVRFIASGGIGEVYEAEDLSLGLRVALKAIQPGVAKPNLLKQELQSARRVTHPNVCRIYDIAEHGDPPATVLTMELLDGPTLAHHLRSHGPYTRREALPLIRQIAAGLQAAHDAGVIHRDFKAANVILAGASRRPVITDFGLALPLGTPSEGTASVAGTPGYMAPEQIAGAPATPATDVYALGVVVGKIGSHERHLGPWMRVQRRCMCQDPARRYQRPADVVSALERTEFGRRAVAGAVAMAILAALVLIALRPPPPHEERSLLLTALDNRSGDLMLDESVPFLLARKISNPQLQVVPASRVQETLRLMRRDPNSRVDVPLGREICLRDGGIGLIANSRLSLDDTEYLLTAELIEPTSGRLLGASSQTARSRGEVARIARKLAEDIRRMADSQHGNGVPGGERLERVTTNSLRACRLYSKAYNVATSEGNWTMAEKLSREAIADDPQFASAHLWLGWCLHNARKPKPEVIAEVEQAVVLSANVTDHERQFILASRLNLQVQFDDAVMAWRRMLSSYPNDFWAHVNLRTALEKLGRYSEAAVEVYQQAEIWPDRWPAVSEARDYAVRWGDLERARRYQKSLKGLLERDPHPIPMRTVSLSAFREHELWLAGNLLAVKSDLDRMAAPPTMNWWEAIEVITFYNTLGRHRDAEAVIHRVADSRRVQPLLITNYLGDNRAAVEAIVKQARPAQGSAMNLLTVRRDWTQQQFESFLHDIPARTAWLESLLRSRFLALHGELTSADRILGEAVKTGGFLTAGWNDSFIAKEMMAQSFELAGDDASALRTLEAADVGPAPLMPPAAQAGFWHRIRYERARLLRKAGRTREAEAIETALRHDLRLADPDHPIVVRLGENDRRPLNAF